MHINKTTHLLTLLTLSGLRNPIAVAID